MASNGSELKWSVQGGEVTIVSVVVGDRVSVVVQWNIFSAGDCMWGWSWDVVPNVVIVGAIYGNSLSLSLSWNAGYEMQLTTINGLCRRRG